MTLRETFARALSRACTPAAAETKASRAARLIRIETGGRARWTPRDHAALARKA